MRRAYIDIPEGQVHYRFEGSGEPLLIPGGSCPGASDEFSEMMPILAKNYRVVAPDILGYGQSDMPPRRYEIEDYARSVISFLDALGIERTNIVGHHSGAAIATEIAAGHPGVVDKLVLSGCPSFEPKVREAALRSARFHPREIKEDGSHLVEIWGWPKRYATHSSPEIWQRIFAWHLPGGLRTYDLDHAVFRYQEEPRLRSIKSPTLLISGPGDPFYPRLEAIKNLIPGCKTKIIEGGDVALALAKPSEFAQAILEFLKVPGV